MEMYIDQFGGRERGADANTAEPGGQVCICCQETVADEFRAPCKFDAFWYCPDCLLAFLEVACKEVTNDEVFPPRCHSAVAIFPTRNFPVSRDHIVFKHIPPQARIRAIDLWEKAQTGRAPGPAPKAGITAIDRDLVHQILNTQRGEYQFTPRPGMRQVSKPLGRL
ncbi:hypothetical protein HRG_011570 [Hirsutella rhossiliensis]|uniref:Uncharacterized protein n=1 Tax=Hirsutella rhossiliensis TaxID=111463 RepID=A0A9P8SCA3_9HYPO|nr:uncharacterized protein HRG_11570 [Hirsutella rhossiliensis]KAH0957423.1 hypothetical protein HRG_11570 [Hirsutella rhossiliensis]